MHPLIGEMIAAEHINEMRQQARRRPRRRRSHQGEPAWPAREAICPGGCPERRRSRSRTGLA
jgi:hypothetical protein